MDYLDIVNQTTRKEKMNQDNQVAPTIGSRSQLTMQILAARLPYRHLIVCHSIDNLGSNHTYHIVRDEDNCIHVWMQCDGFESLVTMDLILQLIMDGNLYGGKGRAE
jgi:hypothetical protein